MEKLGLKNGGENDLKNGGKIERGYSMSSHPTHVTHHRRLF